MNTNRIQNARLHSPRIVAPFVLIAALILFNGIAVVAPRADDSPSGTSVATRGESLTGVVVVIDPDNLETFQSGLLHIRQYHSSITIEKAGGTIKKRDATSEDVEHHCNDIHGIIYHSHKIPLEGTVNMLKERCIEKNIDLFEWDSFGGVEIIPNDRPIPARLQGQRLLWHVRSH
ncbi:hypothetical protein [Planctomicrobium piriforme]|uniref:Uncharacterized protein n=1 Tax=Planctomicrobium piriforme TaxID=1576369 RepID=A0A1I3L9Y4_9PLAN|nr:hypothetical protein [Planctomicrobium piriforme]SFI81583.1 hypothetical protein SAMN05421753_112191 [Planctomicrobium piriforme]